MASPNLSKGTMLHKKRGWRAYLFVLGVIAISGFFLFPIAWLTLTAFKPPAEVFYVLSSFSFTFKNFVGALQWPKFAVSLRNSAILASLATASSLLVTVLSGYLLGRFKNRFSDMWFGLIYIIRTIPYIAWILPLFLIMQRLRLYDRLPGLLLPHIAVHIAFFSLIMKGFFESIPKEMEDAAFMDGCSRWGTLWRIAVPLCLPGLVALAVLGWLFTWNEFLFAFILTSTRTPLLTVTTVQFIHEFGLYWDLMSAAGVMAVVPGVILAIVAQKYIVRGLHLTLK